MSRAYGVVKPALLAAVSETPRTGDELLVVLREQGQPIYVSFKTMQLQLQNLTQQGLVKRSGVGCSHYPYRYSSVEGK